MRDNKGQLLLLAVVFLAITLIVLASAATVFLNVKQSQMNGSLAVEYDNIKEKFGFALNESANKTFMTKGYTATTENATIVISDGFVNTTKQFEILLSYRGINFNADLDLNSIAIVDGQLYKANVTLIMSDGYSSVNETVKYHVWL